MVERDDAIAHILAEVASGRALSRVLAEDDGMPGSSTFWRWHMDDGDLRDNLARARENGVEAHMEEIVSIADRDDLKPDDKRVRVDARVKRAQMIAPRKYGPKLDVTSGNEPLRNLSDDALEARIAGKMKTLGYAG